MKNNSYDLKSQGLLTNFFVVPSAFVSSRILSWLKPTEKDVYLVLCSFANYNTCLCYPSREKIRKLTGHRKDLISAATKRLEAHGLIEKKLVPFNFKGSVKYRMSYKILRDPKIAFYTKPRKTAKYKHHFRKKDGKWAREPLKTALDTRPLKTASYTRPLKTAKKDIERDINERTPSIVSPFLVHQASTPQVASKKDEKNQKKTPHQPHQPQKKAKDSLRKGYRNPTESLGEVIARTVKAPSFGTKKKIKRSHSSLDSGEKAFQLLDNELIK